MVMVQVILREIIKAKLMIIMKISIIIKMAVIIIVKIIRGTLKNLKKTVIKMIL